MCYYYPITTNSKTIRSQVWQLAPAGSSVASPKISGGNLVGSKIFDLRRITLFCLWYRLSKHKRRYVLKICGECAPLGPSATPMPAGKGADMSELQAQHCMIPEQ